MLVYGESYLVTLSETIMMPSGDWRQAIHGDFKGTHICEFSDTKYYQFGDVFVRAYNIRGYIKVKDCNRSKANMQVVSDGEVLNLTIESPIGRAHV